MALTTTTEQVEGRVPITVLALDGELDASNYERLIADVRGLYTRGTRAILLDLGGLTFLASSGLVALHSIVSVLHGQPPTTSIPAGTCSTTSATKPSPATTQREVQLAAPTPAVERVLQRTGMDRLFVVHPDRATGIANF